MILKSKLFFVVAGLSLFSFNSFADMTWEGRYRASYNYITNPSLDDGADKNYFLHHLILTPKIILADGFELISTLDILNSGDYAVSGSQAGQSLGGGISNPPDTYYGADGSPALSDNQLGNVRDANIRELYLVYKHAGGQLRVGRAPLHFGLGINLNNGQGAFDHYFDNRDMISYELFFSGLKFQPYVARITDGFNASGEAANEFGIIVDWDRKESGLKLGLMGLNRHVQGSLNGDQVSSAGAANYQRYGFYVERQKTLESNFRYALELGLNSGKLGFNSTGDEISYNGLGLAFEMDYFSPWKGLKFGLKSGYAAGADASRDDNFSAFAFDRNYDVGMILFNHPVGNPNLDLLSTTAFGRQGGNFGTGYETNQSIDSESIANTIYLSPYVAYDFSSKWNFTGSVLWAQLENTSVNSPFFSTNPNLQVDRDLGFEVDLALTYKPFELLTWETRIGAFFPGKAFEGGSENFDTKSVIGGISRISLKFE